MQRIMNHGPSYGRSIERPDNTRLRSQLLALYDALFAHFGHEPHWWPIVGDTPQFEILVGAVLVQQTRWETVEAAVVRLRDAGAREVHMRVSSPPIRHPCFLGVDMATYPELIAHRMSVAEIQDFLGVDSLAYLSLDGLIRATGHADAGFCTGCFSGNYPVDIQLVGKETFER